MAKKKVLTEDWAANVVGFGVIALLLVVLYLFEDFGGIFPKFSWTSFSDLGEKVFSAKNILGVVGLFVVFGVFVGFAGLLVDKSVKNMLKIYPVIFVLTLVAYIISGNSVIKTWGGENVVFCLLIGLLIGNTFKIPNWVRESITSELFVKVGLVMLGCTIIFSSMMKAGVYGVIQAALVIFIVWNFCFWLCKKMGVDKDLGAMLSSAVSICGVSAAIATSGAIKGNREKLSFVISLVMLCAVPMIILLPIIAKWFGLSEVLAGAWFGGTIDTTGAVAASGDFYGEKAEQVSMIVKSSQNVLLGIAAFIISIYWSLRGGEQAKKEKVSPKIIWYRFPKFVLGFILASLIFSFLLPSEMVSGSKTIIKSVQGFWFALAFTSIGMETDFRKLLGKQNRKATYAFLIAQFVNLFVTLGIAWLLFEYYGGGDAMFAD